MPNGSIDFVASIAEWGVFTGEPSTAVARTEARPLPDNVRQELAMVHVDGLHVLLQFARVTLTSVPNGDQTGHVVVSAYPPFPPDAIAEAARRLLPVCGGAALCMIVQDRTGWAKVDSFSTVPPQTVAAAVAYIKITGGWDESDPIVVEIDEREFQVSASLESKAWRLVVRGA